MFLEYKKINATIQNYPTRTIARRLWQLIPVVLLIRNITRGRTYGAQVPQWWSVILKLSTVGNFVAPGVDGWRLGKVVHGQKNNKILIKPIAFRPESNIISQYTCRYYKKIRSSFLRTVYNYNEQKKTIFLHAFKIDNDELYCRKHVGTD